MDDSKRQPETSPVEQTVGRAVRDTLPLVQHTANELSHAIEDLVSACGSRRPSNTMPAMLRAQTAAASLAAMLESLLRLVALATQPPRQTPAEEFISRAVSAPMASAAPSVIEMPAPARRAEEETSLEPEPPAPPRRPVFEPAMAVAEEAAVEAPPPEVTPTVVEEVARASASFEAAPAVQVAEAPAPEETQEVTAPAFTIESLPAEQQELHRRANRHAKVSMQDIRLLRPKEVTLGKENGDLCRRLRNDLDKARKEYVRRFQPILEHPVDYFHHWAVEILAEGRAEALGEYPYPTPVNRH